MSNENYEFIKTILQEIKIFGKRVNELYSNENNYVIPYSPTYQDMEKAFSTGNASREDILADAEKLDLDMKLINDLLNKSNLFDANIFMVGISDRVSDKNGSFENIRDRMRILHME